MYVSIRLARKMYTRPHTRERYLSRRDARVRKISQTQGAVDDATRA